jgi:spore maturation protein CgeB
MSAGLDLVFLGLSITSSWGNGHATTYRALIRALHEQGHRCTFLERDVPWYAENRDEREPFGCQVELYSSLQELKKRFAEAVRSADAVIVGSYVPEGVEVAGWVTSIAHGATAFYDIDTPVTLRKLSEHDEEYISESLVRRFDLYLSFTGGKTLEIIERKFRARKAAPLYCSVDAERYRPMPVPREHDLGYLGTYSDDRQPTLERLLLEPAQQRSHASFVVAGPCYPATVRWPANVKRIEHVAPREHPAFYCSQRFTLNVTRAEMVRMGFSPSVRLFEAAACGVPIISDRWEGIDHFFLPEREILLADRADQVVEYLMELPEEARVRLGERARARVLASHTAQHRARELTRYLREVISTSSVRDAPGAEPAVLRTDRTPSRAAASVIRE